MRMRSKIRTNKGEVELAVGGGKRAEVGGIRGVNLHGGDAWTGCEKLRESEVYDRIPLRAAAWVLYISEVRMMPERGLGFTRRSAGDRSVTVPEQI